ncbi:hypothetical protein Srufu_013840 [Streptomyces libani subsp. rufus]|nr:hypothetical protein Srufu_013840 [Streptomyces libani subsp. rufus]
MTALLLALIAGAVVGLMLGALGGGGSVLAVPALIYLLGFTPASATTASLIIVIATSLTALYAHARAGRVRWKAGGAGAALGTLTGLLGVGGGFLAVPALVTVLAFEMDAAVGTSLLIITANSKPCWRAPAGLLVSRALTQPLLRESHLCGPDQVDTSRAA